jgi:phosphate transport system substrate-binding protein
MVLLVLTLPAQGQERSRPAAGMARVVVRGAGATFPAPLYEKWIATFREQNPDLTITYEGVGSGEGQKRFLANAVDFGASDAALSDEQLVRVKPGAQLVPVTAGMVVLAYNLPGVGGDLRLSRAVCTDIFMGIIKTWDDPRIRADNPGLALPHRSIVTVVRQDGSGTTYALSAHLSAVSAVWRDRGPGVGTVLNWPGNTMRARGNEGVAGRLKVSEGAIGYVEYHFAKRLGLAMAQLQNRAGRFVAPSEASGEATLARNVAHMPSNLRLFLPDPEGDDAYPIVSLSWLLLYERYGDREKAAALKKFVAWGLTEGQSYSRALGYIPLPREVASLSLAALERVN